MSPTNRGGVSWRLIGEFLLLNSMTLVLLAHLWHLSRSYLHGGLVDLLKKFQSFEFGRNPRTLPLHSSPLLAHVEQTFNALTDRLRTTERNLAGGILHEVEQSRYRALGEISGLIAHDLMAPLHTLQFCVNEISLNPEVARNPRYLEQIAVNTNRTLELVKSLRAYLRNPASAAEGVTFGEAHQHVLRILQTQYPAPRFQQLQLQLDHLLFDLRLRITQMDLVHILFNLYRNALDNLFKKTERAARLTINLHSTDGRRANIHIADNGTGLSAERFERLTTFRFLPGDSEHFQEGLGLRLVRRLIEHHHGSLDVVTPPAQPGTVFSLCLPIQDRAIASGRTNG